MRKVTGTVIGYMCLIDWECEIGAAASGNIVLSVSGVLA